MGPGTPMARAIPAAAVALSRGEPEGLDWLAASVRLSRPPATRWGPRDARSGMRVAECGSA